MTDKIFESQIREARKQTANQHIPEAEAIYHNIIKQDPEQIDALYDLALLYARQSKIIEACTIINIAIAHHPYESNLRNTFGVFLKKLGKFDEAAMQISRAIELNNKSANAWNNLGNVMQMKKNPAAAIACYEKAIKIDPNMMNFQLNLFNMLINIKEYHTVKQLVPRYLKKNPDSIELQMMKAIAEYKCDDFSRAEKTIKKIIQKYPKNGDAFNTYGNIEFAKHNFPAALIQYEKAIAITPTSETYLLNRAHCYRELHQMRKAIACYQSVLANNPKSAEAHFNIGFCYLMIGQYLEGWENYEWRWLQAEHISNKQNFTQPEWKGESLTGKTILVHSEQGYGDIIMFSRFVHMIPNHDTKIILQTRGALLTLLASSLKNVSAFVAKGSQLPAFDYHVSFASLQYLFKITPDNLPTQPYLQPNQAQIDRWKNIILASKKLKVGITWSGSKSNPHRFRSCSLLFYKKLFSIPDIEWFSLQKEPHDEIKKYTCLTDLDKQIMTFSDTAAAISQLDLVISIDTSVAHLAGALGKPVWVLLSSQIDWRWMLKREDSIWYPTARLFRQPEFNDWESIFKRLHSELSALAKGDRTKLNPIKWNGPPAETD